MASEKKRVDAPIALLVEDHPAVRHVTSHMLKRCGFRVLEASDGAEAMIQAVASLDALVVDEHLPGISGLQVLRSLMDCHPRAAAVLISGNLDTRRAVAELGNKAQLLQKPFGQSDLLEAILASWKQLGTALDSFPEA